MSVADWTHYGGRVPSPPIARRAQSAGDGKNQSGEFPHSALALAGKPGVFELRALAAAGTCPLTRYPRGFAHSKAGPFHPEAAVDRLKARGFLKHRHGGRPAREITAAGRAYLGELAGAARALARGETR